MNDVRLSKSAMSNCENHVRAHVLRRLAFEAGSKDGHRLAVLAGIKLNEIERPYIFRAVNAWNR
jgi:hypothetical protein